MKTSTYIENLTDALREIENPDDAPQMASYMKDQFRFLGIKTPQRNQLLGKFLKENGFPNQISTFAKTAMKADFREVTYCGIEIIGRTKNDWEEESLGIFESMIPIRSWWDSVDSINTRCLRPFFKDFPELLSPVTLRWAESDNFWFQRVSLICQLRYRKNMDLEVVNRNIQLLKKSEEFFVQKAIGWILRDYAHDDPEWVRSYVAEVDLKPLSKREALKNI